MALDLEKTSKNEILSVLKLLGLSTHESSAFYTLITHPERTAADISRETGIPDSKIYHALNSLEGRGMISIKKGRPSLYKAIQPDTALANLRNALEEEHRHKMEILDELISKLSGLYESVEGREEMELAYVIHGIRGILGKMNDLIHQAQRRLLLFVADMSLLKSVEQSLIEANKRGVQIELGLTENVEPTAQIELFGTVKRVNCQYGLLVIDEQTLLDLYGTGLNVEMAVLTQRPNVIQFIHEYYKNPKCDVLSYNV